MLKYRTKHMQSKLGVQQDGSALAAGNETRQNNCTQEPQATTQVQSPETENRQTLARDELAAPERSVPLGPDSVAANKPVSAKKLAANRRNALQSTGPRNTEKTRYNALKHGLLASGLTPFDDVEDFLDNLEKLTECYQPANPIENFIVKSAALDIVRAGRMDRLEAESLSLLANADDAQYEETPPIDFALQKEYLWPLLDRVQRYQTSIANRVLRTHRALKRSSRTEAGSTETSPNDSSTLETVN